MLDSSGRAGPIATKIDVAVSDVATHRCAKFGGNPLSGRSTGDEKWSVGCQMKAGMTSNSLGSGVE